MRPTSRSGSRPRTTTRTKSPRSSARLAALVLVTAAVSCGQPVPLGPLGDAANGPKLARDAADVLLRFAAYDYALAGTFSGEKSRIVSQERYAIVARDGARAASAFSSAAVATTANASGPIRDHLVPLADGFTELTKDANAFADGGDQTNFALVIADVAAGWQRLDLLASLLPADATLTKTIARGTSFTVSAIAGRQYALTVGPFSTAADADAAAKKIGTVRSVTRSAPFIVRVGTYSDRPAADAAAAALASKGVGSSLVREEPRYTFTRGSAAPDVELWREPARVFDTWGTARRLAVASDAAWVATGSDDGTVAIFSGEGVLRALPRFNAGVTQLVFSDDSKWLMAGGTTVANLAVPSGQNFGINVRLPAPASQIVFVPKARAFAAGSQGPTGLPAGGPGQIGGRAPDGITLGSPFPITTPAAGAAIAASEAGELYLATTTAGSTDVEVFRVGLERGVRGVTRIPGQIRGLVVDRSGDRAAVMTDQGVYRFGPHDADPNKTVSRVGSAAREIGFGPDATFYVMDRERLTAYDPLGVQKWAYPLVDGRRLVMASRPVVLDGSDKVLALAPDGSADELGVGGVVQDLAASPDLKRVAALVDQRRAVLFTLP
ncbi:MAG: SPOR domain-containing protein [Chloroflexi bacterium]|nr:SPOR domain-containing protein [Chloroflexota bacterium]